MNALLVGAAVGGLVGAGGVMLAGVVVDRVRHVRALRRVPASRKVAPS